MFGLINIATVNLPILFCLIVWVVALSISIKKKDIFQIVIRAYLVLWYCQKAINGAEIDTILVILALIELVVISIEVKMTED